MRITKPQHNTLQKGFTLIELLVVLAIISIMSAIVLFNYRSFGDRVMVSNLAYDIAQSIREMQNYGLSAKGGFANSGCNSSGYGCSVGVRFGGSNLTSTQQHYMTFYDFDGDTRLDSVSSSLGVKQEDATSCFTGSPTKVGATSYECLKVYNITGGNKIKQICVVGVGDTCTSDGTTAPKYLEIVFKRPSPDAKIYVSTGSPGAVRIEVSNSSESIVKSVVVTQTGQISVQ